MRLIKKRVLQLSDGTLIRRLFRCRIEDSLRLQELFYGLIGLSQKLRPSGKLFLLSFLSLTLASCANRSPSETVKPKIEGGSKLAQVTLKQTNDQGQLLWKLQAEKVSYGEDLSIARVQGLDGQLYEQGKPVFKITADQGEVKQSGQTVSLKGQIVATELQSNLVFKGPRLDWQSNLGLLQAKSGLRVTHPQLQLWTQWLQASSRTKRIQAKGKVVAETRPGTFRLKTDQLVWQVDRQFLQAGMSETNSTTPKVEIEQLRDSGKGSRALAGSARLNLKHQIVTLQNPAQVQLSTPPVELTSKQVIWDLKRQLVSSEQLLEVRHRQQGIKIIADRGQFDQQRQVIQFNGQVEATGLRDQSRLNTEQLMWQLLTQRIDARGKVRYIQSSPAFILQGPKAVGKIQEEMIQISGGNVVTEIIP
jgi:LPS export ABC transporter protein LptC